jgi:hypothetical protein
VSRPKKKEPRGEWRKLHNEELHAAYTSSNAIRGIISGRTRWVGLVARMGEMHKNFSRKT